MIIDNIKDPFATVVSIQFGDYLEELLDTVSSLTFYIPNKDIMLIEHLVKRIGSAVSFIFY